MTSFKEFPFNFLLVGLFMVSMIAGAIGFAGNYGKDASEILDEDDIPYTSIREQVNATSNEAERWGEGFTSENPLISSGFLVVRSIWGVMKLVWTTVAIFFNLIFNMAQNYLMIPPIVTGVIMAVMIIFLIFAMWKVLKTGD